MKMIVVLIILIIVKNIFSYNFAITNNLYVDNANYLINNSKLDFGVQKGKFRFGLNLNQIQSKSKDSLNVVDVNSIVNGIGVYFNSYYKNLGYDVGIHYNSLNFLAYNGALSYKFNKKLKFSTSYKHDIMKDTPYSIKNSINYNLFDGNFVFKCNSFESGINASYKTIEGLSSDSLIEIIDSVKANSILSFSTYFLKSLNDKGDLIAGMTFLYSNSDSNFNYYLISGREIYYPYFTPNNDISVNMILVKVFNIKNRLWVVPKITLPVFSINNLNYANYDLDSSITVIGTHQFQFNLGINLVLIRNMMLKLNYEFFEKPYNSYGYFDFKNSYLANKILIKLSYKF